MQQIINPAILRNSFLFREADDSVLREAARHCHRMELQAGETLFEQEALPDSMYFLEDGQIHVVRRYDDGYEVVIATEIPNYVIGELSMLAGQPRTGSVVAVGNCDLIQITRDVIDNICEMYPSLAVRALTQLGARLYALNLKVRESALGNVAARIASVLLLASHSDGSLAQPVTVTRVARATATDADVVERMLQQWATEGGDFV